MDPPPAAAAGLAPLPRAQLEAVLADKARCARHLSIYGPGTVDRTPLPFMGTHVNVRQVARWLVVPIPLPRSLRARTEGEHVGGVQL